ncbi:MAG: hypothetical protein K5840_00775 [Eubacterium sp.]|nr:hypothetical protein [Eubacterium sp.]
MMYFIFRYFTTEHVSAYMVEMGSLVQDDSYTGLCVREETVVNSSSEGLVIYYASAGERVGAHTLVYSIDPEGVINSIIDSAEEPSSYLNEDNYSEVEEILTNFTYSYSDMDFSSVYDLKNRTNNTLRDAMNRNALDALSDSEDASSLELNYAEDAGIIEYYTDGYETLKADNVTASMLDKSSYESIALESNVTIPKGQAVYKLVTDESWQVVIAVSDEMATLLEEAGTVNVNFTDDHQTAYATVETRESEGQMLAILSFTNSMVRYADSRYVNLKLILDSSTGLKIPVSSITNKEFVLVPEEYETKGGDSDSVGFYVLTTSEDGESSVSFVSPTIYYCADGYDYIDPDEIPTGSVLQKAESSETLTLSETASLQGVYCINKGYAVFKQINILYSNSEYAIVEADMSYGLSQYDYIALDSDTISEGELVN